MTIIDTHAHLYSLPDPAGVLREAAEMGVSDVVVLGVDLASNRKHLELIETGALGALRVHLALGLHPGNIIGFEETAVVMRLIREHISRAIAIGETGLDFWYQQARKDEAVRQQQRDAFGQQISLAVEAGLPLVVHARGAWREAFEMVKASGIRKAVFHWYSGPVDVLEDILKAGFLISVSPALEYSPEVRRTAALAPLERVLIETDTPVMVSLPDGSRVPSGPKDVWRTFRALCAVKNVNESAALQVVNANARAFFRMAVL